MQAIEWSYYVYALGYLAGRSGKDDGGAYLTTLPEIWRAGHRQGKADGVTHQLVKTDAEQQHAILYTPCFTHQGVPWTGKITARTVVATVCPICYPPA